MVAPTTMLPLDCAWASPASAQSASTVARGKSERRNKDERKSAVATGDELTSGGDHAASYSDYRRDWAIGSLS